MHLAEIWRYPVKSMAGELLESAELGPLGVPGDRIVQVRIGEGDEERIVTARSRPALLRHRATLDADGEPLVDGRPWRDPSVAADVERAAGKGARLVRSDEADPFDLPRFDILPLLVMTDGALRALVTGTTQSEFGLDRRRFRPNLLIGGVDGLEEKEWEQRRLEIGAAVVQLADLRGRCVMTTFDPDSGVQDPKVLRTVVERLGGVLGLNAEVARGGPVRRGDRVALAAS